MPGPWEATPVVVMNRYAESIPPYSVVEVVESPAPEAPPETPADTSPDSPPETPADDQPKDDGKTVWVTRPESDAPQAVLVTGAGAIPPGGYGYAYAAGGVPLFVRGAVPARTLCGPKKDSFELAADGGSWISLGHRDGLTSVLPAGVGGGALRFGVVDRRPSGNGGPVTWRPASVGPNGEWHADGPPETAIAPALN